MTPRPDNGLPPRRPRPQATPTGIDVPPWGGRRAQEALAQVKARGRRASLPCVICSQPIDYGLTYPHQDSCSVQHVKPRKRYPELTWDPRNWEPSNLVCNKQQGERDAPPSLGITSL